MLVSENVLWAVLYLPAMDDDKRTVCSRSLTDSWTNAVKNIRLTHLTSRASIQGDSATLCTLTARAGGLSQPIFHAFQE